MKHHLLSLSVGVTIVSLATDLLPFGVRPHSGRTVVPYTTIVSYWLDRKRGKVVVGQRKQLQPCLVVLEGAA